MVDLRWSNVPFREPGEWPLLLVGPMVRRVTVSEVHVFIATKDPCRARLDVVEGPAVGTDDPGPPPADVVRLRQIGARLYVGLLTASLSSVTGGVDKYDAPFSYDVHLYTDAGSNLSLASLGLLGPRGEGPSRTIENTAPLGYHDGFLPMFLTPPADIVDLRVAHASCRKPHGGDTADEPDALPIIDHIIALDLGAVDPNESVPAVPPYSPPLNTTYISENGAEVPAPPAPPEEYRDRPHQLILTGDQIYADDVAPALLEVATHAGEKLLGFDEELPGIWKGYNAFLTNPGWRGRYLSIPKIKKEASPGEDDYDQSHLLRFGEFCAMYLLAWSDALWPREPNSTKLELRSHQYRLGATEYVQYVEFFEKIPLISRPAEYIGFIRAVKYLGKIDAFEHHIDEIWDDTRDKAMEYAGTVPYVRRLLANVATYTMFDDHEITDDWFLNRDVAERQLGLADASDGWSTKDLGPRLLRNGLSAYAIFQHWGNVPGDFAGWDGTPLQPGVPDPPGATLLDLWEPDASLGDRPHLAQVHADYETLKPQEEPEWFEPRPDVDWQPGDPPYEPDDEPEEPDSLGENEGSVDPIDVPPNDDEIAPWQAPPGAGDADVLLRIDGLPPPDAYYPGEALPRFRNTAGRMRWDYAIDFGGYRLIALDTRTWRAFPEATPDFQVAGDVAVADRTQAQQATVNHLDTVADEWKQATDVASKAYGDLLDAVSGIATVPESDLRAKSGDLGSALDRLLGQLPLDDEVVERLDVTTRMGQLLDEIDGSADFSGRPPLNSTKRKILGVSSVLDDLAFVCDAHATDANVAGLARICRSLSAYLEAIAFGSLRQAIVGVLRILADASEDLFTGPAPMLSPGGAVRDAVIVAVNDAMFTLEDLLTSSPVLQRSNDFFRDGSGYLAAELISNEALKFQFEEPIADVGPDGDGTGHPTIVLSPAPIFGNELVELGQKAKVIRDTVKGKAGSETWDNEAWNSNPAGFDNLMIKGHGLRQAVVLSGDVHYANSSLNVATLEASGVASCYIQLTSSSAKNSLANVKFLGTVEDLLWARDSRFRMLQFNPRLTVQHEADYDLGDANGPSALDDPSGPSFFGWLLESKKAEIEESIESFAPVEHVAGMIDDFRDIKTPMDYINWHWKWLSGPWWHLQVDAVEWLANAPIHSFVAWKDEILWEMYEMSELWYDLHDDPLKAIFGHFVYARDVLIQEAMNIYERIGVDPFYGLQLERTMLRDVRVLNDDPRFTLYDARTRMIGEPINTVKYLHSQEVQTVGNNNVGLVRWKRSDVGDLGIRHDLAFYPVAKPPSDHEAGDVPERVRTDWMATRHETWFRYPPYVPPATVFEDVPIG